MHFWSVSSTLFKVGRFCAGGVVHSVRREEGERGEGRGERRGEGRGGEGEEKGRGRGNEREG